MTTLMNKTYSDKFDAYDGGGGGYGSRYDDSASAAALSEIRSQLHELTRSVENCQSEVSAEGHFPVMIEQKYGKSGASILSALAHSFSI